MKRIITPSQLTEEECRNYLIQHDREGAEFRKATTGNLQSALNDNLRDFGDEEFSDSILKADTVHD
jgi:hypothetical protein